MRYAFCGLIFALVRLEAQYSELSTTANGSIVYFSTTLARTGSNDPEQGRIYSIDGTGLHLVDSRIREEPSGQPAFSNYYWLSAPEVSTDGKLLAITARRDCTSGRNCVGRSITQTSIRGAALPELDLRAPVHFSANGRYALVDREQNLSSQPASIIDLATGERTFLPLIYSLTGPGLVVTDTGSVVSVNAWVYLWDRNGNSSRLTDLSIENATAAVTDPPGSLIVYTSRWDYPRAGFSRIRVIDLTTRTQRTLIEGFGDFYQPVLSHDGKLVLFLTTSRFDDSGFLGPAQAYVIGTDGSGLRPVTRDPAGIKQAILSGNGRVAFAVTRAGRLLRIDVETGKETELLPQTVSFDSELSCLTGPPVAGSLRALYGVGYGNEAVQIRFDDIEAPIVSLKPGEALYQIPWELAGRTAMMQIETSSPAGPFKPPTYRELVSFNSEYRCIFSIQPEFGTSAGYGFLPFALAWGDDYRQITPDSPAQPGEIVNVYATGLGAVDPSVPTGEPSPQQPLSRLRDSIQCNIPVLYAGLAPGLVGIYQLQFQLPENPEPAYGHPELTTIHCSQLLHTFDALLPVRRR